jgi:hypothetical protein
MANKHVADRSPPKSPANNTLKISSCLAQFKITNLGQWRSIQLAFFASLLIKQSSARKAEPFKLSISTTNQVVGSKCLQWRSLYQNQPGSPHNVLAIVVRIVSYDSDGIKVLISESVLACSGHTCGYATTLGKNVRKSSIVDIFFCKPSPAPGVALAFKAFLRWLRV